jgi:hypothetical protein
LLQVKLKFDIYSTAKFNLRHHINKLIISSADFQYSSITLQSTTFTVCLYILTVGLIKIGVDAVGPLVTAESRTFTPDPLRENNCIDFLVTHGELYNF